MKKQLIKLGNTNPELRKHITPILDSIKTANVSERVVSTIQNATFNYHSTIEASFNSLLDDLDRMEIDPDYPVKVDRSLSGVYDLSFLEDNEKIKGNRLIITFSSRKHAPALVETIVKVLGNQWNCNVVRGQVRASLTIRAK